MRILTVHNRYQQAGGEDVVFAGEASLLRQYGHEVVEYRQDNGNIQALNRLAVAAQTIWSHPAYKTLRQLIRDVQPDVTHVHNTFVLISPAAYYASREAGVPVVQTLHNYRLLCPAATLLRNGRICEECLHKTFPWPGVLHACYRDSHTQSAVTATMLTVHRWLKTWQGQVDMYIALTEFSRQKFVQGGLPPEKIVMKPNFVHPDPGVRQGPGHYALFVGRLSPEKGVRTLLQAWQTVGDVPLKTVGDGPLRGEVDLTLSRHPRLAVEMRGYCDPAEVLALIRGAWFLVFPSEWYETFGRVAIEAFACGVPVLASRLGAMAELVDDGRTGLLFRPGDAADLAAKVRWAVAHPEAMRHMGQEARRVYEEKYTAEHNYQRLMEIYTRAISTAHIVKT